MAKKELVLILSRDEKWTANLQKELRNLGSYKVDCLRQPLDLVPMIWETTPQLCLLDLKQVSAEIQDVLRLLKDNNKELASELCMARATTVYPSSAFDEEQLLLQELGVHSICESGTSVPIFMREMARAREIQHQVHASLDEVNDRDENESPFRMLLFLNDRKLSQNMINTCIRKRFQMVEVNSIDALSGEFMEETPDAVMLDPRGVNRDMKRIAKLARLFPACSFNFLVPEDAKSAWRERRPEYVGAVYPMPDNEKDSQDLLAELFGLLLLARTHRNRVTSRQEKKVQAEAVHQERILVVDDDEEFRTIIAQYLRLIDYDVVQAPDGEAALELLNKNTVDLVISDIYMPKMNGFQLYFHLRNTKPELPTILMTGYNSAFEDIAPNNLDPGVILLNKPFSLNALEPMVRSCLDEAVART